VAPSELKLPYDVSRALRKGEAGAEMHIVASAKPRMRETSISTNSLLDSFIKR
jgi:hypothetical protein